jgi:hypothetical protein
MQGLSILSSFTQLYSWCSTRLRDNAMRVGLHAFVNG